MPTDRKERAEPARAADRTAKDQPAQDRTAQDRTGPDIIDEQATSAPVRRWIAAFAMCVLLAQALIPLRYYFGDDAYDERFSWRMFSAIRMQACDIAASETTNGRTHPVRLMETIHAGWVTTLRRNREPVMEEYLAWRCEHEGVERARLENRCRTPDGTALPTIVRELDCGSGEIRREGGLP